MLAGRPAIERPTGCRDTTDPVLQSSWLRPGADASPSSAATNLLLGRKTSLLVGTGAEYALNHNMSFSVELESYGKISNRVKGNSLTVATRFTF